MQTCVINQYNSLGFPKDIGHYFTSQQNGVRLFRSSHISFYLSLGFGCVMMNPGFIASYIYKQSHWYFLQFSMNFFEEDIVEIRTMVSSIVAIIGDSG